MSTDSTAKDRSHYPPLPQTNRIGEGGPFPLPFVGLAIAIAVGLVAIIWSQR